MSTDVKTIQDQFYMAIEQTNQLVSSLRKRRTGYPDGTQEILIKNPKESRQRFRPQMRVKSQSGQFEAHLSLIKKLYKLSEESGGIVCLGPKPHTENGVSFCEGMKSIWTRVGKDAPQVTYLDGDLGEALSLEPVVIFVRSEDAPEEQVPGYIQVILSNPDVCILFREG